MDLLKDILSDEGQRKFKAGVIDGTDYVEFSTAVAWGSRLTYLGTLEAMRRIEGFDTDVKLATQMYLDGIHDTHTIPSAWGEKLAETARSIDWGGVNVTDAVGSMYRTTGRLRLIHLGDATVDNYPYDTVLRRLYPVYTEWMSTGSRPDVKHAVFTYWMLTEGVRLTTCEMTLTVHDTEVQIHPYPKGTMVPRGLLTTAYVLTAEGIQRAIDEDFGFSLSFTRYSELWDVSSLEYENTYGHLNPYHHYQIGARVVGDVGRVYTRGGHTSVRPLAFLEAKEKQGLLFRRLEAPFEGEFVQEEESTEGVIYVDQYGWYEDPSCFDYEIEEVDDNLYERTYSEDECFDDDDDYDDEYGVVKSYSADPMDYCSNSFVVSEKVPPKYNGKTLYLGVELEVVDESGDSAEDTWDVIGRDNAILKEDGSVSHGFEIVTTPQTLGSHKKTWAPFFESSVKRSLLSYNTSCCGMHVHMSRNCFTKFTLGKFLDFVNREHNRKFMVKLAQRRSDQWASYNTSKTVTYPSKRESMMHDKYTAVNLSNPNTIEVRIFRGTLNEKAFFKNLEFCEALVEYVQTASIKDLVWEKFILFINSKHKYTRRYSNLIEYMELREYGVAQAEWSLSTGEEPPKDIPEEADVPIECETTTYTLQENPYRIPYGVSAVAGVYVPQADNFRVLLTDGGIVEMAEGDDSIPLSDYDVRNVIRYNGRRSLNATVLVALGFATPLPPPAIQEAYSDSNHANLRVQQESAATLEPIVVRPSIGPLEVRSLEAARAALRDGAWDPISFCLNFD